MNFPEHLAFRNHLDGQTYLLCRADLIPNSLEVRRQIVEICSQDLVYGSLFKEGLKGEFYTEANADDFLSWARAGWKDNSHYVFLLMDKKGNVCGCIDIKSSNLQQSEIGYWASVACPGNVTNALAKLCSTSFELGFTRLIAYVKTDNGRSIKVLLRVGFERALDLESRLGYLSFAKTI